MRPYPIFALLAVLAGCRNHNTYFPTPLRVEHADSRVHAIYFDRYGDLYPGTAVSFCRDSLQDGDGLRDFFARNSARSGSAWRQLIADTGLSSMEAQADFPIAWQAVQTRLKERAMERIRELGAVEGRPVVMLVHGFNNEFESARSDYDSIRTIVDSRLGRENVRYLDVYWDGMNKAFIPIGIWGEAQYNFPLVGVQMRPILAALPPSTPLRILTHSTGGPLIATVFGPTHTAFGRKTVGVYWPRDPNYRTHLARDTATTGAFAPPRLNDTRVAMMIPAASAKLFDSLPGTPGFSRLILGYSPRDYSVRKGWIVPCRRLGATCLGTRLSDICGRAARALGRAPGLDVRVVRLSNASKYIYPGGDHAWLGYLKREGGQRVLDLLLSTQTDTGDNLSAVCGSGS